MVISVHYIHIPRPPFPLATQINSKHGKRYQTINGKSYPSITSILSATSDKSGIIQWRKSIGKSVADYITKNALDTGSRLHKLVEEYLNNPTSILFVIEGRKITVKGGGKQ